MRVYPTDPFVFKSARDAALLIRFGKNDPAAKVVMAGDPSDRPLAHWYLTGDKLAGFGVDRDGELVSLFSAVPGRLRKLLSIAGSVGAYHLNHVVIGNLSEVYESCGWRLVRREEWRGAWKYGDDVPEVEYRVLVDDDWSDL